MTKENETSTVLLKIIGYLEELKINSRELESTSQ